MSVGECQMLIVNDDQLHRASIASLEQQCLYCSRLAAYPLIMSDDADQTVYHAACAGQLATEIMVDVFTFFRPPAPYPQLFVLTPPNAASAMMPCGGRAQAEGGIHAVNEYSRLLRQRFGIKRFWAKHECGVQWGAWSP